MNQTKKISWLILFALVILCLILFIYKKTHQAHWIQGYIEGYFRYIASPLGGRLEKLPVDRGDHVEAKQLLFVLEAEPEKGEYLSAKEEVSEAKAKLDDIKKGQRQTQLDGIKAQIKQAEIKLRLADLRLTRSKKLAEAKLLAKDSLDQALTDYEAAQQELKHFQSNLAEAEKGGRIDAIHAAEDAVNIEEGHLEQVEWKLNQKTQKSPYTAYIYDTYFSEGEYVPAGKPVVSMIAPQDLRIVFFVAANQLGKIKLGQKIEITCESCKETYPAKIVYVAQQAEYTPPVIYSRDNNDKIIFRIQGAFTGKTYLHPGQPVLVGFGDV